MASLIFLFLSRSGLSASDCDDKLKDECGSWYGGDHFISTDRQLRGQTDGISKYPTWFFQFTFCATASTIVSGALAERTKAEGFLIYACFMTGIIYPMVVHWTWGTGWLSEENYSDFAGSGVVHMVGGIAAMWGAIIVGPRVGRYDKDSDRDFSATSPLNVALGAFFLWFGWYGFNAGSTLGLTGNNFETAGRCAVTTTLSAAMGGITCAVASSLFEKKYDLTAFANGILGGLVSITAGCANLDTHVAMAVGTVGGLLVAITTIGLDKLGHNSPIKIDDPIGAFPVHGMCGAWGVIAEGLFNMQSGMAYGTDAGGDEGILVANLMGIAAIFVWVSLTSIPIFVALKFSGLLRIDVATEEKGMDSKMVAANRDSLPVIMAGPPGATSEEEAADAAAAKAAPALSPDAPAQP